MSYYPSATSLLRNRPFGMWYAELVEVPMPTSIASLLSDRGRQFTSEEYRYEFETFSDYYPFGMPMPGRQFNSEDYRYGFNGMEKDDEVKENSYNTFYRSYDARLGRWSSPDPLRQFFSSQYSAFANNPILLTDPSGGWVPDVEVESTEGDDGEEVRTGFLFARMEDGDDAQSLSEFLGIDIDQATDLFNEMGSDSKVKVPDEIAAPINQQIQHYLDNPMNYEWWAGNNFNCWSCAINTSQGKMPPTEEYLNYNLDTGIEFTRTRINESQYENVSETPHKIKFGKTVLRLAEDKGSWIFAYNQNSWCNIPSEISRRNRICVDKKWLDYQT